MEKKYLFVLGADFPRDIYQALRDCIQYMRIEDIQYTVFLFG